MRQRGHALTAILEILVIGVFVYLVYLIATADWELVIG